MRNRIVRACSVLVAGVAVSVIGLSAASMASAATVHPGVKPAATPACGFNCFNLFSLVLGHRVIQNAYVPGDTGAGGKVGQKVNMNFASNSHPNEDFTGAQVGTLADFCPQFGGSGLSRTSYVCIHYQSTFPVFEANWSPFGNESGLCVGARMPVFSGENVTLQNCGATTSTIWVGDLNNAITRHRRIYLPWVNGADTNFSHQLTLTVDPGTSRPMNQLKLQSLNKIGGQVPDTQQFSFFFGPANDFGPAPIPS
ncbi:MAG: hypothetical protein ACRDNZ_02920 [Streptosporangiaceae bacterium]